MLRVGMFDGREVKFGRFKTLNVELCMYCHNKEQKHLRILYTFSKTGGGKASTIFVHLTNSKIIFISFVCDTGDTV